MRTRWPALITLLLLLAPLAVPAAADRHDEPDALEELLEMEGSPDDLEEPWRDFVSGWKAFASWHYLLQEMIGIAIAAVLASFIAYHPRVSRDDADAWERPKAIVIYAVVGSLIAKIVRFNPPMAFVIFGIGGLMRFRSLMGSAKDTGLTILAVVIGLACGLNMFAGAIFGTVVGWSLVWVLEARRTLRLEVRKLTPEQVDPAEKSFRAALEGLGVRIRSVRRRPAKGRIAFDANVPRSVDPDQLEDSLDVPPELKEKAIWEWPS